MSLTSLQSLNFITSQWLQGSHTVATRVWTRKLTSCSLESLKSLWKHVFIFFYFENGENSWQNNLGSIPRLQNYSMGNRKKSFSFGSELYQKVASRKENIWGNILYLDSLSLFYFPCSPWCLTYRLKHLNIPLTIIHVFIHPLVIWSSCIHPSIHPSIHKHLKWGIFNNNPQANII